MMDFVELNIETHGLDEVARLIYNASVELSVHVFGKTPVAYERIKKMMILGGNSFGMEHVYIAQEGQQTLGVLVAYPGSQTHKDDGKVFLKTFGAIQSFKFVLFVVPALKRLITMGPEPEDFYVSNICVAEGHRSKGVGSFMIENSRRLARDFGCTRIVLDVDVKNEAGIRFYEREGFEMVQERQAKIGGVIEGTWQMALALEP